MQNCCNRTLDVLNRSASHLYIWVQVSGRNMSRDTLMNVKYKKINGCLSKYVFHIELNFDLVLFLHEARKIVKI